MTSSIAKATAALGALALPLIAGATAQAQTVRIEVSDLDLSQPAQAATLNLRIERAAGKYCGALDVQDLARRDACREAFREAATDQLKTLHREEQARSAKTANSAG